ncbi:protein max-like [Oscarella lobularis]|uniref:protein max-like n=1 Tax=Oscarella lobularis TaxID=121494 RepID=UPI00331432AB
MSDFDDDRDIDVENDDDNFDKRRHHNALERRRRDHIKDSFTSLRDAVPSMAGEKASRAQVLNKATDYIELLRKKTEDHERDIDELKRQNDQLQQQISTLERTRVGGVDQGGMATLSGIIPPVVQSETVEPEPKRPRDN